ncbi:MAG: hypothetical protein ABH808_01780 [Candidatus Kuenenbacteria bacterium]
MKKIFLIILEILIGFIGIYFLIFLFSPSSILDFYIYPNSLEFSDSKELFLKIKPFGPFFQITHTNRHKSNDLKWSLNKKYLAFYENIRELAEKPFSREWALKIINPKTFKIKTIFIGDYKTGEYQWLDDQKIRVYCNAGTGVRIYRDININISEPFIAIEHSSPEFWTPIKVE